MQKKRAVYITLILIVCLTLLMTAFVGMDIKTANEDFTKISVCFLGDASTSRAFSFYTADTSYENICDIQIDPAQKDEEKPSFSDKDNIIFSAASEYTKLVFPSQLRHYGAVRHLLPDTKYFYRVGSKKRNKWSLWGYFVTEDNDGKLSFLHITDPQAKTAKDFAAYGNSLQKAYDTLGIPEFIVSTGDQVELGLSAEMWDYFFAYSQHLMMKTTMAPVSGNHEFVPQAVQNHFYLDSKSSLINYSFEADDALFVILDTNDFSLISQIEWAEEVLRTSSKKWKIVAFHKAPFSSGTHADDSDVTNIRNNLVPILASCGVDLVLNGHDHVYCRTYPLGSFGNITAQSNREEMLAGGATKYFYDDPEGVIYVINRTIGTKFYGKSNDMNDNLIEKGDTQKVAKPIFSHVAINGNNLSYTAYEYDRDGSGEVSVYDAFGVTKS